MGLFFDIVTEVYDADQDIIKNNNMQYGLCKAFAWQWESWERLES